jgi:hypothetical protein
VDRVENPQLERGDFRRKSRARSQEFPAGKSGGSNFGEIRTRNESEFRNERVAKISHARFSTREDEILRDDFSLSPSLVRSEAEGFSRREGKISQEILTEGNFLKKNRPSLLASEYKLV